MYTLVSPWKRREMCNNDERVTHNLSTVLSLVGLRLLFQ